MFWNSRKTRRILSGFFFAPILLLFLPGIVLSAEPARKNVLLVSFAHPEMPFYGGYFAGIREACDEYDPGAVEIFQEFMDVVRLSDPKYVSSLPDYYRTKYASRNLDAIVTSNPDVYQSLAWDIDSIFPGIPVLYDDDKKNAPNAMVPDIDGCIDLALRLQPTLKRLFVIAGSHPMDVKYMGAIRRSEEEYPKLEFVYLQGYSFDDLISTVSVLPENSAIFFSSFFMDSNGSSFVPVEVARKVSRIANCPMYGVVTTLMGHGIVGGSLLDPRELGVRTGRELLRVLYGENAVDELAPLKMKAHKKIDEHELLRWGFSAAHIPAGYEIVNRVPSIWREYRQPMILVILFIFAESALIFSLLIQRRRKRTAEKKLLGTLDALEHKQDELSSTLSLKSKILESLRESETTLQTILSSIPVGVLIVEADSGIIRQANRAAGELMERSWEDLTGIVCPGSCKFCNIDVLSGKPTNGGTTSFENCIYAGGKKTYVLQTIDRITLDGKSHFVECFLDITGRKAAEKEAREREAQLVHADRMISLGTMAAGIAHEINNPNNFISLNAPFLKVAWESAVDRLDDYVAENGDFPMGRLPYSRAREHIPALLRGIMEGSERIRNIVHDMKEFVAEKPAWLVEDIDINWVLKTALNLLSNTLNKSARNLTVEYGPNIPVLKGNAQRLEQVIVNLILNAVQALPDPEKALSIKTSYEPQNSRIVVEVSDEGIGIALENMKRIFDPFFTTKRESGGTGLGLAISNNIVRSYNGRILISSTAGEGTTARLELPAPAGEVPAK